MQFSIQAPDQGLARGSSRPSTAPAEERGDAASVAAARERRRAWARRSLAAPNATAPAESLRTSDHDRRGRRSWSVNVERLDRERVLRGWTQRQLAQTARVDPGTLGDLLARRRRPMLGTVQAICLALNFALGDVI